MIEVQYLSTKYYGSQLFVLPAVGVDWKFRSDYPWIALFLLFGRNSIGVRFYLKIGKP